MQTKLGPLLHSRNLFCTEVVAAILRVAPCTTDSVSLSSVCMWLQEALGLASACGPSALRVLKFGFEEDRH